MHAEYIKEQKFSGSFFPWKKVKKTHHCSSGSLPSASILSKIKLIERRLILRSWAWMFSGSLILKLLLFLLLMCMWLYVCLLFFYSPCYMAKSDKENDYFAYILSDTQISEQARPQFLIFASLTFLFKKNTANKMSLNAFAHLKR